MAVLNDAEPPRFEAGVEVSRTFLRAFGFSHASGLDGHDADYPFEVMHDRDVPLVPC